MAIQKTMDLELIGWDNFRSMMGSPDFRRMFERKIKTANKMLAQIGAARLSQEIKSGRFKANSTFTTMLKGSSRPLIDHGDLFGSVKGTMGPSPYQFLVGVKRITNSGYNLAHMLETGFTIKVTEKMRRWFWAQAKEHSGLKGLKSSTTHIYVPPRPYMDRAFLEYQGFPRIVLSRWKGALDATFRHFVRKADKDIAKTL
jgi:hypothetical protein